MDCTTPRINKFEYIRAFFKDIRMRSGLRNLSRWIYIGDDINFAVAIAQNGHTQNQKRKMWKIGFEADSNLAEK